MLTYEEVTIYKDSSLIVACSDKYVKSLKLYFRSCGLKCSPHQENIHGTTKFDNWVEFCVAGAYLKGVKKALKTHMDTEGFDLIEEDFSSEENIHINFKMRKK